MAHWMLGNKPRFFIPRKGVNSWAYYKSVTEKTSRITVYFTCPLSQFRGFNLYVINYSELFFLVSTVAFVICLLKILASFKSL